MAFLMANEARGRTIAECYEKAWMVQIACENGHGASWPANELPAMFPAQMTLDRIAARLVCRECGSRTGGLGIRQDTAAQQARDVGRYEGQALKREKRPRP